MGTVLMATMVEVTPIEVGTMAEEEIRTMAMEEMGPKDRNLSAADVTWWGIQPQIAQTHLPDSRLLVASLLQKTSDVSL